MNTEQKNFPYDASGKLFDYLREKTGAADDKEMARHIGIASTTVSRVRNGWMRVPPGALIKIFETTGTPLTVQSELIGDAKPLPRNYVRVAVRNNDKSGKLFDFLRQKLRVSTDKEMAQKAGVSLTYVSQIRHGKKEPGDLFLMRINRATGVTIKKMRDLIGEKP